MRPRDFPRSRTLLPLPCSFSIKPSFSSSSKAFLTVVRLVPSTQFGTTRTTVRKALDELLKEGFIEKEHGKGSRVLERGKSLGLMSIKGFSGSTDYHVKT